MFENIRWSVEKFEISFVENGDDVTRKFFDEGIDRFLSDDRAGRVVGVGDENEARVIGDRGGHRIEIVGKIWIIDLDIFRAEKRSHQFVNDEGVFGGDEFGIAVKEGVTEELDDFVRAVAEDDVGNVEAEFFGDCGAEFEAAAVWVDVGLGNRIAHGLLGKR